MKFIKPSQKKCYKINAQDLNYSFDHSYRIFKRVELSSGVAVFFFWFFLLFHIFTYATLPWTLNLTLTFCPYFLIRLHIYHSRLQVVSWHFITMSSAQWNSLITPIMYIRNVKYITHLSLRKLHDNLFWSDFTPLCLMTLQLFSSGRVNMITCKW